MAMFSSFEPYAGDPILGLNDAFAASTHPDKVNLSVGVFLDATGRVPVMRAVREAGMQLAASGASHAYLPIPGDAGYRDAAQRLIFGERHVALAQRRVATIQTPGGSGALRVGADVLRRHFPASGVWLSDPSWDNHRAIFEAGGFAVQRYPYYDARTRTVDFERMLACLAGLPSRSIVVLHACCHNPTGCDLTEEQWRTLVELAQDRGLIPFIDMAYQGMGRGIVEDAFAVRLMAELGAGFLVATSFSKNFSLYGERCGTLSFVCADEREAALAFGQMQMAVRANYSSPSRHGSAIVATVLAHEALRGHWTEELAGMRRHMRSMRTTLRMLLEQRLPALDWDFLTRQSGMFAYTGLSERQVGRLRADDGVYLVGNGRMCVAGLQPGNVERVAEALARAYASPPD